MERSGWREELEGRRGRDHGVDGYRGGIFGLGQIFPGVESGQWERYLRRYPFAFADARTLHGRVGSYLLRLPGGRTVLVDTGVGPSAMGLGGGLMDGLAVEGVAPEDVDTVFLTNLHGDHIGWALTAWGEPASRRPGT